MFPIDTTSFLEQKASLLQITLGWMGNAFGIFFFLSPAAKIYSLYNEKIDHTRIAYLQYVSCIVNCILWLVYGLRRGVVEIWFCNVIGLITNLFYLSVFLYFYIGKSKDKFRQDALKLYAAVFAFFALFMWIFESLEVAGNCAMLVNIVLYASPGQKIFEVIKTGDYQLIPIESSIIAFLCSFCWFIYGIMDNINIKISLPNGLGILFSSCQIACWIYFSRNQIKKTDKNQNLLNF